MVTSPRAMPDAEPSPRPLVHPRDESLLAFALLPQERTLESWERVSTSPEFWGLGAMHLRPLVSRALVESGIDAPELPKLTEAARMAWLENEMRCRHMETTIEILSAASVRTMFLKGLPLALLHYPDLSLRPMTDVDMLVEPDHAVAAVAALEREGWIFERTLHHDFVARTTEVPCRAPDGHAVIDLHWRLIPWIGRSWSEPDPGLWAHARPLAVGRSWTLAPAAEDLLLHVLLHAYRSGWAHAPRWVADTVVLLRSAPDELDWGRFLDRVVRGGLALPVRDALGYAAARFRAPIPPEVLSALARAVPSRRESRKYRRSQRESGGGRHRLLGEAPQLATSWARISLGYSRRGELASLAPFLRGRMHVDRLSTLPYTIVRRRWSGRDAETRDQP